MSDRGGPRDPMAVWFDRAKNAEAEVERLTKEVERKQGALQELIACKELDERANSYLLDGMQGAGDLIAEYRRRNQPAWSAARRAVLPAESPKEPQ